MDKFTIENMNLYYGKFHALKDVNIRMKKTESQPSTRSFIRLSDFKRVDLPQPDGPMKAVILFFFIRIFTSFNA